MHGQRSHRFVLCTQETVINMGTKLRTVMLYVPSVQPAAKFYEVHSCGLPCAVCRPPTARSLGLCFIASICPLTLGASKTVYFSHSVAMAQCPMCD